MFNEMVKQTVKLEASILVKGFLLLTSVRTSGKYPDVAL